MRYLIYMLIFTFFIGCSNSPVDKFQDSDVYPKILQWSKQQHCAFTDLTYNQTLIEFVCTVESNSPKTNITKQNIDDLYSQYIVLNQKLNLLVGDQAKLSSLKDNSLMVLELKNKLALNKNELKYFTGMAKIDNSLLVKKKALEQEIVEMESLLSIIEDKTLSHLKSLEYYQKNSKKAFLLYKNALDQYVNQSLQQVNISHSFSPEGQYINTSFIYFFNEKGRTSKCFKSKSFTNVDKALDIHPFVVDNDCFDARVFYR